MDENDGIRLQEAKCCFWRIKVLTDTMISIDYDYEHAHEHEVGGCFIRRKRFQGDDTTNEWTGHATRSLLRAGHS